MTLQELRYLVAVADKGHFSNAAEACHVSQSTLSTQLRKLEDYLDVALFERNKRHVLPTPVGKSIIAQARVVLEEVDKVRHLARYSQDPMSGTLRLGVIPTLGPYLLPQLLPEIRASFDKLRLILREDITQNLIDQLHAGQLDAVLIALPVPMAGLDSEVLFREPFQAALPSGHDLMRQSIISQQDLTSECVLLLEEGHCLRDQALEICGWARDQAREAVTATSLETLWQMVAAGVGCTLLPQLAITNRLVPSRGGLVAIRPFAAPVPQRTIGLIWRRRFPREETVRRLAHLIRRNLPEGVQQADLPDRQAAAVC